MGLRKTPVERPNWFPARRTIASIPRLSSTGMRALYIAWHKHQDSYQRLERVAFATAIAAISPGVTVHWCDECALVTGPTDQVEAQPGRWVDGECFRAYWQKCSRCDGNERGRRMSTPHGATGGMCYTCLNDFYVYCGECDTYFLIGESHKHPSCCESPAQLFTIRNLTGGDPIPNETKLSFTIPSESIDNEGIKRIQQLLMDDRDGGGNRCWHIVAEMDPTWQMRSGNFTRRLSSNAWKNFGVKLSKEILSEVGNIAQQHTSNVSAITIDVTRDFNQGPGAFANSGSCWWNGYVSSRCALKTNGGFGLRTFDKDNADKVTGRAWVLPLKENTVSHYTPLLPTFDTMNAKAFVVFNGYRSLGGYLPARIMAHLYGMTYKRITFTGEPMYVNSNVGYLVGTDPTISQINRIELSLNQHANLYDKENK